MKFITFLKTQLGQVFVVGIILSFTSCGSFQYSGIYEDGIYSDSSPVNLPVEQSKKTAANSDNTSAGSNYYSTYFKEKSLQLADDNTVFTDIDSYQGAYEDDPENGTNYAGWGENNSNDVVINIYDNNPYYGNVWGLGYRNNWGWNLGWNNWGYNLWQPYLYDPWYSPFCNYGYNNFGYNPYPYSYIYGYNNYRYNNYRGRSVAYVNGRRGITSRNSSLSSRSVLSTTNRNTSVSRARTRSATRNTNESRSTTRTTTRSRSTVSNPKTRSTTRSSSTPRPTTTRSSTRVPRPNTTTRSTRTSTRSSSPTRTRSRSTTSSSRSSSRSSSSRRRD